MSRTMWGNDSKHVYRAVVTISYPAGYKVYGYAVAHEEMRATEYLGPYMSKGQAKAAMTRFKKEHRSWRFNRDDSPQPKIDYRIEAAELNWFTVVWPETFNV